MKKLWRHNHDEYIMVTLNEHYDANAETIALILSRVSLALTLVWIGIFDFVVSTWFSKVEKFRWELSILRCLLSEWHEYCKSTYCSKRTMKSQVDPAEKTHHYCRPVSFSNTNPHMTKIDFSYVTRGNFEFWPPQRGPRHVA